MMKRCLYWLSLACLLVVLLPGDLLAQIKPSTQVETVDGKSYYIHTVAAGETLYAISNAYRVSTDAVVIANPGSTETISIGQTLRIPAEGQLGAFKPVPTPAPAPEVEISGKVEGDNILHTVQPQETLYSLSRKYGVSIVDLESANPELSEGLRIGMELKVPAMKASVSAPGYVAPAVTEHFIGHEVGKGQTLWAIAQMYGVTVDTIRAVNQGHFEHFGTLKEGYKILVPKEHLSNEGFVIKESLSDGDTVTFLADSGKASQAFDVAMLLPFYLDINDTLTQQTKRYEPETIHGKSSIALQFYQGAMLAVDSLRKRGLSVRLHVFDTGNDTAKVLKVLANPVMQNVQLVIGPLYRKNVQHVIAWAKDKDVPVVCPVPQPNRILLGNSHVCKVAPSATVQVEQMAKHIIRKHLGSNVVVLSGSKVREEFLATTFMNKCNQALEFIEISDSSAMPRHQVLTKFYTDSLKRILRSDTMNIIVVPSTNQTYVSQLISGLRRLTKTYRITVFGMENWKNFASIDVDYLHSVNLHIVTASHINYDAPASLSLMRKYRAAYHTDPDKYGFLGFDVTSYFLNALRLHGTKFPTVLTKLRQQGIGYDFAFFKTGLESGLENKAVHILKYQDYQLVKVD